MEKRLNEIIARRAEIKEELKTADEKRLAELNTEVDSLLAEEEQLRARMDIAGKLGKPEEKPSGREENVLEERAKQLYETGSMRITAGETRNVLVTTGGLAKPTSVGGINDPFNVVSSIIDLVQVDDLTGVGAYKEAYITAWQTAAEATDGTANSSPSDPGFKTAAINPQMIDVLTYVSKNLKKQTPLAYEEKVRKGALIALRKKAVEFIIKGDGATQPYGIYNAENTADEAITQELLLEANTIDEKILRSIVFAYGGDENIGAGAKLFLNKLDLIKFGDVRGTSEKKAVYEIIPDGSNPNTGVIKDGGLTVPYVICSDCTALSTANKGVAKIPTMIYGAPGAYKLGLFGDYEINVSADYKFAEGLLSVKGEAMIGGNVVADKGFVVVTLNGN